MKMMYDNEEKCCYNEEKLTFIHFVITSIGRYYLTLSSPLFHSCFYKDELHIHFEPPKIENKNQFLKFLKQLEKEVGKYES
jgi:hypothetical protein